MLWSLSMVHFHLLSSRPINCKIDYFLWCDIKIVLRAIPFISFVTTLGPCVKWPLGPLHIQTKSYHDHKMARADKKCPKTVPNTFKIM